jgi:hypothetical protein
MHSHLVGSGTGRSLICDLEAIDKQNQKSGQINSKGLAFPHPQKSGQNHKVFIGATVD